MQTKTQQQAAQRGWLLRSAVLAALGAFGQVASAGTLTSPACTSTPGATTCDLKAVAGSATFPGAAAAIPVWGYAAGTATSVTQPGGPVLIVHQGDTVTVNLTNNLTEATSILFEGQTMVPDTTGAAALTGTKAYTFTASKAGTFLYEAGLVANNQHQVAMGLYGLLIVRPSTAGQAYATADTAFTDEAAVLLSEVDPALNTKAGGPSTFEMRGFSPKYFLINGKAHPQTDVINFTAPVNGASTVLLRYGNAGVKHHSMTLLGKRQMQIANDGNLLNTRTNLVTQALAPGQTVDTLVTIPSATPAGTKFALYDGSFNLHNNTAAGLGGMLTYLSDANTISGNPLTTGINVVPNPTDGTVDVAVTATTATTDAGGTVSAAELFIDSTAGTAIPMVAGDGLFDTASEAIGVTIPAATVATLTTGNHTLYIRGVQAGGTTPGNGPFATAALTIAQAGPTTGVVTLTPAINNGAVAEGISAPITGTVAVTAAEYFVDTQGANGAGCPMTVTGTTAATATGSILTTGSTAPCVDLSTLSLGNHTVYVHGRTGAASWGAANFATFNFDNLGPLTSGVTMTPTTSNGTVPVYLTATGSDAGRGGNNVTAGRYTLNGVTTAMTVVPGPTATLSATIPAATIAALPAGTYTITVESQDAAGLWGPVASPATQLTKIGTTDTTAPVTSVVTVTPSPNNGTKPFNALGSTVRLTASITDAATGGSNITAGEVFVNTVGTTGTGLSVIPADGAFNAVTEAVYADVPLAAIAALAEGPHPIYVHGKDAANNWEVATAAGTMLVDKTGPVVNNPFTAVGNVTPMLGLKSTDVVTISAGSATDPNIFGSATSSGVTAAQYFVDALPTAGAMTLTAGTPSATNLAGTIPVATLATLANGNHNVTVQAQDGAGNWGGARTVTNAFRIDRLFANSFASAASPYGWNSVGGTAARVAVDLANQLSSAGTPILDAGTGRLAVSIAGLLARTSGYVIKNEPPAAPNNANVVQYNNRFLVSPNGINLQTLPLLPSATPTIFAARGGATGNTALFAIQLRRVTVNPPPPPGNPDRLYRWQVRLTTNGNNGTWFPANAPTGGTGVGGLDGMGQSAIELRRNAAGTQVQLFLDGVAGPTMATTNTPITREWLGVSAGLSSQIANNSVMYFDSFISSRTVAVGQ